MTVKEVDKLIENLPRSILLLLVQNIMREYAQARRQIRLVVKALANEEYRIKEEARGLTFPNKNRLINKQKEK